MQSFLRSALTTVKELKDSLDQSFDEALRSGNGADSRMVSTGNLGLSDRVAASNSSAAEQPATSGFVGSEGLLSGSMARNARRNATAGASEPTGLAGVAPTRFAESSSDLVKVHQPASSTRPPQDHILQEIPPLRKPADSYRVEAVENSDAPLPSATVPLSFASPSTNILETDPQNAGSGIICVGTGTRDVSRGPVLLSGSAPEPPPSRGSLTSGGTICGTGANSANLITDSTSTDRKRSLEIFEQAALVSDQPNESSPCKSLSIETRVVEAPESCTPSSCGTSQIRGEETVGPSGNTDGTVTPHDLSSVGPMGDAEFGRSSTNAATKKLGIARHPDTQPISSLFHLAEEHYTDDCRVTNIHLPTDASRQTLSPVAVQQAAVEGDGAVPLDSSATVRIATGALFAVAESLASTWSSTSASSTSGVPPAVDDPEKLRAELQALVKQNRSLERALRQAITDRDGLEQEGCYLSERLGQAETKLRYARQEIKDATAASERTSAVVASLQTEVNRLRAECDKSAPYKDQVSELVQNLSSATAQLETLEATNRSLQQQVIRLTQTVEEAVPAEEHKNVVEQLSYERSKREELLCVAQAHLKETAAQLHKTQINAQAASEAGRTEIETLRQRILRLKGSVAEVAVPLTTRAAELLERVTSLEQKLAESERNCSDLRRRITYLEQQQQVPDRNQKQLLVNRIKTASEPPSQAEMDSAASVGQKIICERLPHGGAKVDLASEAAREEERALQDSQAREATLSHQLDTAFELLKKLREEKLQLEIQLQACVPASEENSSISTLSTWPAQHSLLKSIPPTPMAAASPARATSFSTLHPQSSGTSTTSTQIAPPEAVPRPRAAQTTTIGLNNLGIEEECVRLAQALQYARHSLGTSTKEKTHLLERIAVLERELQKARSELPDQIAEPLSTDK